MNPLQSDISARVASPIQRIRDAVASARRILVVSHIDPDGDALGTQLAFGQYLRDLGKDVLMVRDSEIPDKYRFLPQVDRIVPTASLAAKFKSGSPAVNSTSLRLSTRATDTGSRPTGAARSLTAAWNPCRRVRVRRTRPSRSVLMA